MPIAWHGPFESLKPETRDMAMALQSLMEELEAVDWYGQRMDLTNNDDLRRILEHNRDEEKEHAAMLLEWIRRKDAKFDATLKTYLFTTGDVVSLEEASPEASASGSGDPAAHMPVTTAGDAALAMSPAFTVGSLRPKRG